MITPADTLAAPARSVELSALRPVGKGVVPELGQDMMDRIAAMQESYRAEAARAGDPPAVPTKPPPTVADPAHPGPAAAPIGVPSSLATVVEALEHSARMQAHLARFVMLSSISSALGRDLNAFLRGQ